MVFKKYIRKGGKIYGPYLYENKRVDGRVVTNYVGKHEDKKKNFSFLAFFLIVTVFLFISFFSFQYFTGSAVSDGGTGYKSDSESGSDSSDAFDGSGSGSSQVEPGQSVRYENPPIFIGTSGIPGAEVGEPIVVSSLGQVGATIAGELAEWSLQFIVDENTNAGGINFDLPIGSKYASVRSDVPVKVSIRTIQIEETNIFDVSRIPPSIVEVKIDDPLPGNYDVRFFTPGAYVSEESVTSNGKDVVVNNPWEISYGGVAIVVGLEEFFISNPDSISVISKTGEEIDYSVFDIDKDGNYDFVKFYSDLSSKSKETFRIISSDIGKIQTGELEKGETAQVFDFDFGMLSDECKESVSCGSYKSCTYDAVSDAFDSGVSLKGVEETVCVSDNSNCPPTVRRTRECSLKKDSIVIVQEDLDTGENLIIIDSERENPVAEINLEEFAETGRLDIVFLQSSERYSPECYNGVHDVGVEESIDCGGDCKECLPWKDGGYYWILWPILLILVVFFYYTDKNSKHRLYRLIRRGRRALSENDLKKAVKHYELLRKSYSRSSHPDKRQVRHAGIGYHAEIRKKLKEKKISVRSSHDSGIALPGLIYDKKGLMLEEIDGGDFSRIKKLIEESNKNLTHGKKKQALLDYEIIKRIYKNLDKKDKKRIGREYKSYVKMVSK